MINRFYDIQDGRIRYDGINVNKIKKTDLRRSLGIEMLSGYPFVYQKIRVWKENIRFGKLDATDEEIVAAAKLANADGFIRRLPQRYDTMLTGDGANLSQGQRQLLAIARAAVADPPVLILDEATSSIDTRTERIIPGKYGSPDARKNDICHRASSFHSPQFRLYHGSGTGTDHRARYS